MKNTLYFSSQLSDGGTIVKLIDQLKDLKATYLSYLNHNNFFLNSTRVD